MNNNTTLASRISYFTQNNKTNKRQGSMSSLKGVSSMNTSYSKRQSSNSSMRNIVTPPVQIPNSKSKRTSLHVAFNSNENNNGDITPMFNDHTMLNDHNDIAHFTPNNGTSASVPATNNNNSVPVSSQQQATVSQSVANEQEILDFISENIRGAVRDACKQAWLRGGKVSIEKENLPISRQDMTDHYHQRALDHIKQAKQGMNIITVVQMEKWGTTHLYRLRLYELYVYIYIVYTRNSLNIHVNTL